MKKQVHIFYLIISLLTAFPIFSQDKDRYVVVLSLDGFRYDYTEKAYTPTLDSLAMVGLKAAFQPCFPSVTFSNHYSMATGLHPDHHGLINNYFYAEDLKQTYLRTDRNALLNPSFYGGEPIWNTAEKQGVRTATFYWVGSEVAIQGQYPSIYKPYDGTVPFQERADSVIAWLQLPESIRPHLVMWYLEEPDAIGHKVGPDDEKMRLKIEELDQLLHYFFTNVRSLDIFDHIDFILLSDHGMAAYEPDKMVNLEDYLSRDWFEHIFGGIPTLLYPKEEYIEIILSVLETVPYISAYRKSDIPERLLYGKNTRISEIVVIPEVGVDLQFRTDALLREGGAHGYDNYVPEMQGIFYGIGPSFKKNIEAPSLLNLNLYLILCHLLQITPAPNDGNPEAIRTLFSD